MNKIEAMKQAKDGLDAWPDLLRHAKANTPVADIPEDELQRMKWFGVFHRPQTPGEFMMRLRIAGGRLTSPQAHALAAIASEFGHGSADITSRQNIQLRGIALADVPEIVSRLDAAGVVTLQTGLDNVRNYIGCPLAGIDGMELFDTTPLLAALGRAHLGDRAYSNLPRKLNVSIAGCRDDCGHAQTQDVGFVPATRDIEGRRVAGFNVLAGGALGGTSPRLATAMDVFIEPAQVVDLFLAILRVYRDNGPREKRTQARLKWLLADWGDDRFRSEVEREFGRPLLTAGTDERLRIAGDHLGVHPQRQVGLNYVGLHVAVGRISAAQLGGVADIATRHGAGDIRLTIDQNVIVPHVPDRSLPGLLDEPLLGELKPNPAAVWRNLVACTGTDYCHYSLIDTKTHAVQLAAEIERRGVQLPRGTRIHVSGCVHACGKHHIADIGLQGTNIRLGKRVEESVDVYAGGRLGHDARLATKVVDNVHVEDLPVFIEALVRQRFQQKSPLEPWLAALPARAAER